ncbi:MAG: hypothetical protein QOC85_432 [Streptomyces sp.]|jgi:hypothetical protein|nr:hypothetical protein [Streptomyces sp.]
MGLSRFAELLKTDHFKDGLPFLMAGQGIGDHEAEYLRRLLARHDFTGARLHQLPVLPFAGRAETHKTRAENVLIADLRESGDGTYTAALRVNDSNEMILDHGNGDHVSGMVLMEAARQMGLAVAERYFIPAGEPSRRFTIHDWNVQFRRFLVPLHAELVLKMFPPVRTRSGTLRFQIHCEIVQAGECSAVHEISFSAFPADSLKRLEDRQITETLKRVAAETRGIEGGDAQDPAESGVGHAPRSHLPA